jgi:hypothetical protein
MMNYHSKLGNVEFNNPVWIAASPFTENYESIERCIKAGAGGIVIKSVGKFERKCERDCYRCEREKRTVNFYKSPVSGRVVESSSTNSEHCERLTIEEANALIKKVKENFPNFPIITSFSPERLSDFDSVSGLKGDVIELNSRYFMRRKGPVELMRYKGDLKHMIRFNYLQILVENQRRMNEFKKGIEKIKRPTLLKIVNYPEALYENQLDANVDGFTASDSEKIIRFTMNGDHNVKYWGGMGSISGDPLKWSSYWLVRYIRRMYPDRFISASGGIFSAEDAKRVLNAGADTVQLCSTLYFYGYHVIRKITKELAID